MISDIIIIVLIVGFTIAGFKHGISKTLLNIAGLIVTVAAAYYLSDFFAGLIYDCFIEQTVITNLEQLISSNGIDYAVANCFEAVPQWISGILSAILFVFGTDLNSFEKKMAIPSNITSSAVNTVESSLESVITSVFKIILIIVFIIIVSIIVKKLIRLVSKVFNIPVIKQVNKLLGGILGVVEGIIFVWIAVNVFYFITSFTASDILYSNFVAGTLFKLFCVMM